MQFRPEWGWGGAGEVVATHVARWRPECTESAGMEMVQRVAETLTLKELRICSLHKGR